MFVYYEIKILEKGRFIDLSNEYKFTYVPRLVCSEKKVFLTSAVVLIFSRENAPVHTQLS